jgi:hypothetical protein
MSTPLPSSALARKISDLEAQYKYLCAVQEHHLLWRQQTQDREILRLHDDIDKLLSQLEERYLVLLGSIRA